jgi:hypothetical protein
MTSTLGNRLRAQLARYSLVAVVAGLSVARRIDFLPR